MQVIAVCRSRKRMRAKTAQVLDRYLFRLGDRTWRGRASGECLKRISQELRANASRNMAVALYKEGGKSSDQRPLFIVGSRSRLSRTGLCPIFTSHRHSRTDKTETVVAIWMVAEIAALFHDVGKASRLFQEKIHHAALGGASRRDAVRHEVISTLAFAYLVPPEASSPHEMARVLKDRACDPDVMQRAWDAAADRCYALHADMPETADIIPAGLLGDPEGARAQILLLVLSHHRLPEAPNSHGPLTGTHHIDKELALDRSDLDLAPGVPFWHEEWFAEKVVSACDRLLSLPEIPLRDIDILARTPLMMADHVGSSENDPTIQDPDIHLANTSKEGGPGDTLSTHVRRVVSATRPATMIALGETGPFPAIAPDETPLSISNPVIVGNRFDWQARAAIAAQDLVSARPGGFFGALTAGTGTGKTRGAAVLMSAVTAHDANESKRGLRLNLALPLRTLARQSGIEYIEDLGFSPDDVRTLVGGRPVQFIEDDDPKSANPAESGSEDRLTEFEQLEIQGEDLDAIRAHLSAYSADAERRIPAFIERIGQSALCHENKVREFFSAPVLAATIDHFMPAASPLRGSHLAATLRSMTADLVIDEVDLLSEEDLSAVKRLIRIVGLAGRRVLIMSATLPADIARSFFEVYRDAYRTHSAVSGVADHVNFLCASDADGSITTSADEPDFAAAFSHCQVVTHGVLQAASPVQLAYVMPRARDWQDQISLVSGACDRLHAEHHFEHDGFRISAGLVRITRVQHLQALAIAMGQLPANAQRVFVTLHSKMPRVKREFIERSLKSDLTRKGDTPNAGIVDLLRDRKVFDAARRAGRTDIQIIILASPVIETGNDLDFDWLIADPSSSRSLVQAAGRVNRHRRIPVAIPNVAVIGDYLVVRTDNFFQYPGVETEPHAETSAGRVIVDCDRSTAVMLGVANEFAIDARLTTAPHTIFAVKEAELRHNFDQISAVDFTEPLFWWNRRVGRKHRFRRSDRISVDLIPVLRPDDGVNWIFHPSRHSSVPAIVRVRIRDTSLFSGSNLFPETLSELLQQLKDSRAGQPELAAALSVEIYDPSDLQEEFHLDPVLGLLKEQSRVDEPRFSRLHPG